jgi:hypothetical protein
VDHFHWDPSVTLEVKKKLRSDIRKCGSRQIGQSLLVIHDDKKNMVLKVLYPPLGSRKFVLS